MLEDNYLNLIGTRERIVKYAAPKIVPPQTPTSFICAVVLAMARQKRSSLLTAT
jgi:hypothetical protein